MDKTKSYLKSFIWSGEDALEFESWLYTQDSAELEALFGPEKFMTIKAHDYRRSTIESVKQLIKENISDHLNQEFEDYFAQKGRMIKGKCIKTEALDYNGTEIIDWGVEIGETYDIIVLIEQSTEYENHPSLVNYVDKEDYFVPAGYVPMELFEIDKSSALEHYKKEENEDGELITEPIDWSQEVYEATHVSFWEDYYEEEEKAVSTYFSTLEKLGIKHVW